MAERIITQAEGMRKRSGIRPTTRRLSPGQRSWARAQKEQWKIDETYNGSIEAYARGESPRPSDIILPPLSEPRNGFIYPAVRQIGTLYPELKSVL